VTPPARPLKIPARVMTLLRAHLESGYPLEACGVLLGRDDEREQSAVEFRPMRNTVQDRPHDRYQLDPREQLAAQREAHARGLEIIGIVHSHPDHPARPSRFDTDRAMEIRDSFSAYVVARVERRGMIEARAYRLDEPKASFEEMPLVIDDA
jgi:proteasome lid subunit RPN8/RPN11